MLIYPSLRSLFEQYHYFQRDFIPFRGFSSRFAVHKAIARASATSGGLGGSGRLQMLATAR